MPWFDENRQLQPGDPPHNYVQIGDLWFLDEPDNEESVERVIHDNGGRTAAEIAEARVQRLEEQVEEQKSGIQLLWVALAIFVLATIVGLGSRSSGGPDSGPPLNCTYDYVARVPDC